MLQDNRGQCAQEHRLIIVDPCAFGREGLKAALSDARSVSEPDMLAAPSLPAAQQVWRANLSMPGRLPPAGMRGGCLVVRLPADPRTALALLLELGTPAVRATFARWVTVLLTPVPATRVRELLAATGGDLAIRVVDDRQPVSRLRRAVRAACRASACAWDDIRHVAARPAGPILSERECRVLLFTLQGVAMADVARRHAVSYKTLYSQRHTALLKLGVRGMCGLLSLFYDAPQDARS